MNSTLSRNLLSLMGCIIIETNIKHNAQIKVSTY
nr:MAG TPA: hypothetical protein [Caudoviricetes sp.]